VSMRLQTDASKFRPCTQCGATECEDWNQGVFLTATVRLRLRCAENLCRLGSSAGNSVDQRKEIEGQTRYLDRFDATGLVLPDKSGRQLRFHFGNRADIEVAN